MNAGMKDMLNVMSKFLALGMPLDEVIVRSTWHPARQIRQENLGNLSVGAPADVAVLRLERGRFGFVDVDGARWRELKAGLRDDPARRAVVYELNGLGGVEWDRLPADPRGR